MTLYKLRQILQTWPVFLETVEPHLASVIRAHWPEKPPCFDEALAAALGPPRSPAWAAFVEALAALDRRDGDETGHGDETGPAKPAKAKRAVLESVEDGSSVLYGEVIPPDAPPAQAPAEQKPRAAPTKARARELVREQLKHGPKPESTVIAAAHLADIPKRSLIAAADALGVRTQKGQWWLPG